jgi:hypothetical protein
MRLPAGRSSRFRASRRDGLVGEPDGQAAAPPQCCVVLRPVRDPIARFWDMMTMLGVVFEWHRGVSGCLRGSSLHRSSSGRQPQPIRATTSIRRQGNLFTIRSRSPAGTGKITPVTPVPQANEVHRNSRPLLWILSPTQPLPCWYICLFLIKSIGLNRYAVPCTSCIRPMERTAWSGSLVDAGLSMAQLHFYQFNLRISGPSCFQHNPLMQQSVVRIQYP